MKMKMNSIIITIVGGAGAGAVVVVIYDTSSSINGLSHGAKVLIHFAEHNRSSYSHFNGGSV